MKGKDTLFNKEGKKIQFIFDPSTYSALKGIKTSSNSPSFAQAVRNAILLTNWLNMKRKEGYEICLKKGEELERVLIPF